MICYIPKDYKYMEELIKKDKLYEELFLYRADYGCSICEKAIKNNPNMQDEICCDCLNNPDKLMSYVLDKKETERLLKNAASNKRIKSRNKILSIILEKMDDCPICNNKKWTGILAAYFADGEGNIKLAELEALYCPFCGRNFTDK